MGGLWLFYPHYPGGHFLYKMVAPGYPAKPFFRHYKMEENVWSGSWMVYQDMFSIFFLGKYYFIEATWGLTAGKLFI